MILYRDLYTGLGLDLKLTKYFTTGGDKTYEGCTASMLDTITYGYKPLNIKDHVKQE